MRLATVLLLASVTAAQAQLLSQHHAKTGTPASQMADRAHANANKVRDAAANGITSLYASPGDASADQPSATQSIIRSDLHATPNDPVLHYPYGRYGATLGNVDPNSLANPLVNPLANPLTRGTPGMVAPPTPFTTNAPAFGAAAPTFHRGR